jgi:predicted metal-dependent peptidase
MLQNVPVVHPRLIKARAALLMDHAFFGALAMRLPLIQDDSFQTMATDAKAIYYSQKYVDSSTDSLLVFTFVHEILHVVLGHHTRRGQRDALEWNISCDHAVNLLARAAGFKVPDWAYCDARFTGLCAEQVYAELANEKKNQQKQQKQQPDSPQGQGQGNDGQDPNQNGNPQGQGKSDGQDGKPQGQGKSDGQDGKPQGQGKSDGQDGQGKSNGQGDPGGCGEILDVAPAHDRAARDESVAEWQVFTRQAAAIARKQAQGAGPMPGFLKEIITALDNPRIDWREILRRFVSPSRTKDWSWSNPSKRMLGIGYIVPGLISDGVSHVVFAIDSSGSMDTKVLAECGAEVQSALDDGAIDKVTVIFADTAVRGTAEYLRGEQIDWTIPGRGGTAFSPTFAWIDNNLEDVNAVIYCTDLDCTDYGEEPAYPVLWAAYGSPLVLKYYKARVPFGEILEIPTTSGGVTNKSQFPGTN